jgi:hypothetical protein
MWKETTEVCFKTIATTAHLRVYQLFPNNNLISQLVQIMSRCFFRLQMEETESIK